MGTVQLNTIESRLLCLIGGLCILCNYFGNFFYCKCPCLLPHRVDIHTACLRRRTKKCAYTFRSRMCDLRNNLCSIGMNFICKLLIRCNTFLISKAQRIPQIRNARVHRQSIQDNTSGTSFCPGQPVILHSLIYSSILAFISQRHRCHKCSVLHLHGSNL